MTMVDTKQLKEKVVIITGASSGIGRSCAVVFASEGAFLSVTGRNIEALNQLKLECCQLGLPSDKVLVIQADLADESEARRIIDGTVKNFGRIDILVNNAGIMKTGPVESCSMDDIDQQMKVNVRAPFFLTKLAIPHLLKTKGNCVNVSSVAGLRSFPNVTGYCMSKAALDQMTRCLALELAGRGVRVNAVNPGVIKTELHKRGGMDEQAYANYLEHSKVTHAMGRVGEVEEVARAVVFLASAEASFITGTTLPIDGGKTAMCPR